ncbi:MAG: hypothetical protein AAFZ11_03985 [Pseudomonadota bacterium]
MRFSLMAFGLCLGALPSAVFAQETGNYDDWGDDGPGKVSITALVAVTNSTVVLTDSEVTLPDDFEAGDIEVSLAEELKVSNTLVGLNVGYRVLPFLDLNVQGGLVETTSDVGLTIEGTPADTFPIDFGGPISFATDVSTEASGYSFGGGATGFLPVVTIGDDMVLAYASYQHVWNEFDDDGISVDIGRLSAGLVYPVNPMDDPKPVFRLGASYVNSTRTLERGLEFNGDQISIRATQETDDPWFGQFGISYPASRHVLLNFSSSVQTTGDVSVIASITFTP